MTTKKFKFGFRNRFFEVEVKVRLLIKKKGWF